MQTLNNCPSWVTPKDLTYISNKRDFLGLWTQSHDLESNISLGFMAVVKICCLMADVPNPRTPKSILFFLLHFFNSCPNAHLPTQLHEIKFTFWRYSTDKHLHFIFCLHDEQVNIGLCVDFFLNYWLIEACTLDIIRMGPVYSQFMEFIRYM